MRFPVNVCRRVAAATVRVLLAMACVAGALPAQSASLVGSVTAKPGERPVANAEIALPGLNLSARSDSAGRFRITGIPAGRHQCLIRVVGYDSLTSTLEFSARQKLEVEVVLTPTPTELAPVKVVDRGAALRKARLAEFEARRRMGIGRFVTADVFEKSDGRPLAEVLARVIPGTRTDCRIGKCVLTETRVTAARRCNTQVIVNGLTMYNARLGQDTYDINTLSSSEIIGLEYYTIATTPPQLMGTGSAACGTVVLWTK